VVTPAAAAVDSAKQPWAAVDPKVRTLLISVAGVFFVNGMVFSNWLPRIPEVRDRLGITNQGLGLSLLGGGLGGLVGSFFVATALKQFGTKQVVTVAATLGALGLPIISVANSAFLLFAALSLVGFCDVLNDMAMNSQAVMGQRRYTRPILNRMHGAWSMGFVVGALLGSLARAAKLPIRTHFVLVALVLVATIFIARRGLLPVDDLSEAQGAPKAKLKISVKVVAMAVVAIGIAVFEAAPNDWSAVILKDEFKVQDWTGLGVVTFAGLMLVGRLFGDHVLERIGSAKLMNGALALTAIGAFIVVIAPSAPISLLGFATWGLGVSVLFPQLYETAATLPGASAGAGLAAMAVGQRFGFLTAPVAIGTLAKAINLPAAFAIAIGISLTLVILGRVATARRS
jgi:MFS family permease